MKVFNAFLMGSNCRKNKDHMQILHLHIISSSMFAIFIHCVDFVKISNGDGNQTLVISCFKEGCLNV